MTQEDKELLLKDLSGRLPYGVNGLAYIVGEPCNTNTNIVGIINKSIVTNYESPMPSLIDLDSKYITIKPYLRPMSSMTEEEQKEFVQFHCVNLCPVIINSMLTLDNESKMFDFLNAHHFDYRNLIEKGLAIEVTEENNPYK